jgi:hypothetical protein
MKLTENSKKNNEKSGETKIGDGSKVKWK